MSIPKYPRGSQWRIWDLHLHSPATVLNNNFEGKDSEKWERYLKKLESLQKVGVLGITDYFSIDGYTAVKGCKEAGRLGNIDLLLPNVELRVLPVTDQTRPINLHFIFSQAVVNKLESQFFQNLEFHYADTTYKCTRGDLIRLGRDFKDDPSLPEAAAYREGVTQFKVMPEFLHQVLNKNEELKKNCVVAVANSSQDGASGIQHSSLAATRQEIYRLADLIFSGNPNDICYFLGKGTDPPNVIARRYGGLKPCVTGSDAHSLEQVGAPSSGRHTWIKADPTFEGLKQILNEPEDRVEIGLHPRNVDRMVTRATRIMTTVEITKRPTASTTEKWFNVSLPLNPGLIAVIGNKGSGKSALADILGLLGNTPRIASFSFLKPDRFRDPKNNKAKQFQASLIWADETNEGPVSLNHNPEPDSVEKIKYIPQNYLEDICNEVGLGKGSRFYAELKQVIFSHVPETERLGFSTLEDLLDHRTEETYKAIELLVTELKALNKEIVACEAQLSTQHRKALEAQLAEKRREFEAHKQAKPKGIPKPEENPSAQQQSKATSEAIEKKQTEVKVIEKRVEDIRKVDSQLAQHRTTTEKLLAKLQNLERQVNTTLGEAEELFRELGLDKARVISIMVNTAPIEEMLKSIARDRDKIGEQLDSKRNGSLEYSRVAALAEIAELQMKLNAPQREYQAYLQKLKEWETNGETLIGSEHLPGSIKHIETQLANLQTLPKVLKQLETKRDKKSLEIFREKQRLRTYYATYYGAVQTFLSGHPLATTEHFKLTFNVSIVDTGFAHTFLNLINQRKVGPFAGVEEGTAALKRLLSGTNFDSGLVALRFTRKLFREMREHDGRRLAIKDQLSQGSSLQDLYDFVFSLSYLSPVYNLRWDNKGLEQLSPGERGHLLLIFYLLVDQDDIPLIIDQPEENLDNQTVYKTLVPCIKDAKERRQIILVTHNPNLAVVCDADQVICAEIRKDASNEVIYTSGSIEEPLINHRLVDILEGTRPAFDKREDKYL